MDRDFETDNIGGFISISLSDCKTIGQYADKQSEKYTKSQREGMIEDFKTKKSSGMKKLPKGMNRMKYNKGKK